jgi:hypothetical protein
MAERALSEHALSELALSELALSEQVFSEQVFSERALSEQVLVDALTRVLGKRAVYRWAAPPGVPPGELEAAIEDTLQRSRQLGDFLVEPPDTSGDEVVFTVELEDRHDDVPSLAEEYSNLLARARDSPDDNECVAQCGFFRDGEYFCRVCAQGRSDSPETLRAMYAAHLERAREALAWKAEEIRTFLADPLPESFSYEFAGDGWECSVRFELSRVVDAWSPKG